MSYVVGGCNVVAILSMADVVCLEVVSQARPFLRLVLNVETACGGHELGLYGMSCCEILLLLNMANMDCLLCRRVYIVQCSFSGCE